MHDIWNPWHGCKKISEGCDHCYMYFLDRMRDKNGSEIYRTGGFDYPLQTDRRGVYKIRSGESIRVCMTSDFFIEEADKWRAEAWEIMRRRSDVRFFLLTKRPERVEKCLPCDWEDGYENVFFNVTAENQRRADERVPVLLSLPFKHKGVMCAPFIGEVTLEKYLAEGQIEQVICGGENYDGARPCDFEWVKRLRNECESYNVTFAFIETGTKFIKDGKTYTIPSKRIQAQQAYRSGMNYIGKPMKYRLTDSFGLEIPEEELFVPYFGDNCAECGSRIICAGCFKCGKCQ